MNSVPDDVWNRSIEGRLLRGSTLGAEVGADRTLLVFLRHFG